MLWLQRTAARLFRAQRSQQDTMPAEVKQEVFGQTREGQNVIRYTLSSSSGSLVVKIIDFGGVITEILVPDRDGRTADVNLGFDDMAGYEPNPPHFGALIGRFANRIAGGQFVLDGKTYDLFVNNGPNSLHGGRIGFDRKLWSSCVEGNKLILKYVSANGEENYPGLLTTTVIYRVTDNDELVLEYEATTTQATALNLTNHAYFNLAGHDAGKLDDHFVTIHGETILPLDENSIPTGVVQKVEGTAWDLRTPVRLGDRLLQVPGGKGFDINFCLPENTAGAPQLAARVEHRPSGRYMECSTTEPGMQFYTSFYLNAPNGKGGTAYGKFGALCLEAQHYPDSVHQPSFPNTILRPGETYRQTTIYKFGAA